MELLHSNTKTKQRTFSLRGFIYQTSWCVVYPGQRSLSTPATAFGNVFSITSLLSAWDQDYRNCIVDVFVEKRWRKQRLRPPDSPLDGAARPSVDGRGHRSPRRVDIFVIPAQEQRIFPERKDRPGINLSLSIHIGKLNSIHSCLGGRLTAVVMTWGPLPDSSAYYQLATVGASASMNCRQIITFNKHLDVQLAVFHLAWNISSAL